MLEMRNLKRNAAAVASNLKEQKDGSVYTKAPLSIFMPKRFLGTPLLDVSEETPKVVGKFMVLVGKNYSVADFCAIITLGKCDQTDTLVDGVECVEFKFETGDLVYKSLHVPINTNNVYHYTHTIHKLGTQLPWITEDEFQRILDNTPEFAGMSLPHYAYVNIYSTHLSRVKGKPMTPYRLGKGQVEFVNVPLDSVILAVDNTLSVLGGNYLEEGIQGKLITPSTHSTAIEEVLL